MTLEQFASLTPTMRTQYAELNPGNWLERLSTDELDEVGRLLCHATPTKARDKNPIMGDFATPERAAQEQFETRLFGYEQELTEDMQ